MKYFAGIAAVAIAAAGLTMTSGAKAVTLVQTIGDNDGYGAAIPIPDNGNTGSFATVPTDNRSAGEAAAVNGAQFTDVYSSLFPGLGPNTTSTGSFFFSPFSGVLTSATLRIDMADFQSSTFGPILANINGVALPFAFNDGSQNSVVRDFVLNAAQLAAVNAAGFLSLNLNRNGSNDLIAFDYLQLTADSIATPLPGALPLFAGGLGLLGLLGWRRKRKGSGSRLTKNT